MASTRKPMFFGHFSFLKTSTKHPFGGFPVLGICLRKYQRQWRTDSSFLHVFVWFLCSDLLLLKGIEIQMAGSNGYRVPKKNPRLVKARPIQRRWQRLFRRLPSGLERGKTVLGGMSKRAVLEVFELIPSNPEVRGCWIFVFFCLCRGGCFGLFCLSCFCQSLFCLVKSFGLGKHFFLGLGLGQKLAKWGGFGSGLWGWLSIWLRVPSQYVSGYSGYSGFSTCPHAFLGFERFKRTI